MKKGARIATHAANCDAKSPTNMRFKRIVNGIAKSSAVATAFHAGGQLSGARPVKWWRAAKALEPPKNTDATPRPGSSYIRSRVSDSGFRKTHAP